MLCDASVSVVPVVEEFGPWPPLAASAEGTRVAPRISSVRASCAAVRLVTETSHLCFDHVVCDYLARIVGSGRSRVTRMGDVVDVHPFEPLKEDVRRVPVPFS